MKRLVVYCLVPWAFHASADDYFSAHLEPMRDYGYAMGDVVVQNWTLDMNSPYRLDAGALPGPGARHDGLELRDARWRRLDGDRYRVTLTYQVFPTEPTLALTIPSLPITVAGRFEHKTGALPATQIGITPYLPRDSNAGPAARPLQSFAPADTADLRKRLTLWITGLVALGAGWFWLDRARRRDPFTVALGALARSKDRSPNAARESLRIFHRALNEVAGFNVMPRNLETFLAAQPDFLRLKPDLEHVLAASRTAFFDPHGTPLALETAALIALCRQCRAICRNRDARLRA